jgi:hypothetical protein
MASRLLVRNWSSNGLSRTAAAVARESARRKGVAPAPEPVSRTVSRLATPAAVAQALNPVFQNGTGNQLRTQAPNLFHHSIPFRVVEKTKDLCEACRQAPQGCTNKGNLRHVLA